MKGALGKDILGGSLFDKFKESEDKRTPIKKGCNAQGPCYCTGRCQEVIGYIEPGGEKTFLKCSHGKFLSDIFGCEKCRKEKEKLMSMLTHGIVKNDEE